MDLADPYHPIMDNVAPNSFQGFTALGDTVVANGVISTSSVTQSEIPTVCGGGYMEVVENSNALFARTTTSRIRS